MSVSKIQHQTPTAKSAEVPKASVAPKEAVSQKAPEQFNMLGNKAPVSTTPANTNVIPSQGASQANPLSALTSALGSSGGASPAASGGSNPLSALTSALGSSEGSSSSGSGASNPLSSLLSSLGQGSSSAGASQASGGSSSQDPQNILQQLVTLLTQASGGQSGASGGAAASQSPTAQA